MTQQTQSGHRPPRDGTLPSDQTSPMDRREEERRDGRPPGRPPQSVRIPVFMPWAWYLAPEPEAARAAAAEAAPPPPSPLPPPPVEAAKPDLLGAENIIKDHTIAAMAIGLIPVPLVDMAALAALQLRMAHKIGARYGVALSDQTAQALIAAATGGTVPVASTAGLAALISAPQTLVTTVGGSVLAVSASAGVASLFKLVPVVGTLAGGASLAIIAGATTFAIGRLLVGHFESGGTLLSGNPARIRAQFRREFRAGKTFARRLRAWQQRETSKPSDGGARVRS